MEPGNHAQQSAVDRVGNSTRRDRPGSAAPPPGDPVEVEFDFPAELASLPMVRRRVEQVARVAAKLGPDDLDKLRLVLTEVVANAIGAHAERNSPDALRLRCSLSDDRLEVSVLDRGGGFMFTTGSHPVIDTSLPDISAPEAQQREGGFGLGIIDTFADETEFRPVDGGTAVRFVIYPGGHDEA
ncbi:MAG: ATP-binding protein [Microthrixaceae bacterium]|nr:ATP-binding protein [Microthrixaceae bacterium]